ncbi:beta-N-acetylhexosaminidase [Bacillus sp. EAC]|uniref:beta-N-acetylhexosaminidase n=1 Tax=Bacillus sp. EAC TaxID=1978338 RepID=UPI000B43DE7C|nr:beta-N-acetylhexosaminidase [Bacillus sp. EAC]
MIKKVVSLILILFLIGAGVVFYVNTKISKETPKTTRSNPVESEVQVPDNTDELLANIISNAKAGKIDGKTNITVGKTTMTDITKEFGTPDQEESIAQGTFLTYSNPAFAIGTKHAGSIFEARSYDSRLNQIHFESILETLKKPTSTKYYKDQNVDQIILDYRLSKTYELKFILARPTNENPNPSLHHTAVLLINGNNPSGNNTNVSSNIDNLLNEMSLNEKIGQMILSGFYGPTYSGDLKNLIQQYKIGGFIFYSENLKDKNQTVKLINSMKSANGSNSLPILFGVDQEGGRISRLPEKLGNIPTNEQIGKRNNSNFSYEIGQILGEQLKIFGFNTDFAPVLDINSNPNNPVIGDRSFGNNASIVSKLGIKTMEGIQSERIIPVVKHFPGHGDTGVDSHLDLPVVNKTYNDLKHLELIPFENAIQQKADAVMIAHILLPKIDSKFPSSMSKNVITNILRNDLHYSGVVMTDDMTMAAIEKHYDLPNAAVKSIQAGSDIIMVAHDPNKVRAVFKAIQAAVQNGKISEDRINQSVKRIILLKQKYKIDNNKVPNISTQKVVEKTNKLLKK